MFYKTILTEERDQMGILTLNRPEKLNAFTTQLAEELNAALMHFEERDIIRVAIIQGAGKAFSAGIDVDEFFEKKPSEYQDWIRLMNQMHLTIASMRKPVVAMVHGYAVANGAGLMAASDFAIAAEGTLIGTTAINVGLLCAGPIIPMSYSLGKKKTLEMLLCGDMIDAKEAERLGLVNKVVPPEKLQEETFAFAQKLIAKSSLALRMGKSFYYRMLDMPFAQRLEFATEILAQLCNSEDAREGIRAFVEKRRPIWKGR